MGNDSRVMEHITSPYLFRPQAPLRLNNVRGQSYWSYNIIVVLLLPVVLVTSKFYPWLTFLSSLLFLRSCVQILNGTVNLSWPRLISIRVHVCTRLWLSLYGSVFIREFCGNTTRDGDFHSFYALIFYIDGIQYSKWICQPPGRAAGRIIHYSFAPERRGWLDYWLFQIISTLDGIPLTLPLSDCCFVTHGRRNNTSI